MKVTMKERRIISKIIKGLTAAGLILALFTGSASPSVKLQNEESKITLFHINDAHSRIDDFAKIAWLIKEEKKKNADVFFFDAGDNFSGNPIVDQYDPKGQPMRDLLNLAGVDALCPGNHEFDYGQEILKIFMKQAKFPIICANIKVSPTAIIPQPQPYVILKTKKGIKIALLGLIQVDSKAKIPDTHPAKLTGLTFTDGVDTALSYRFLKDISDVFIALTHLGYETDEILAGKMKELDIIIGGHSHTLMQNPVYINNVLIVQTGAYAAYLGRIDITIKNSKIIKKESMLIKVDTIKGEIPEIRKKIDDYNNNPRLNRVFAVLPRPIEGKPLLGNLVTDAIREIHHLDVAFHNEGGTRSHRLDKEIRLKDIYTLLPFGNDIVLVEMTPAEIRSLIRYDFERHDRPDLFVSGITYTIKHTADRKVKDIEIRDRHGNLLDENSTYKVGMNDYIVSSYNFAHRDAGKSINTTVEDSLIEYIKQGPDIIRRIDSPRIRTEVVME